ncbi:hypothetical protein FHR83_002577 [Actinoplanes campanulatus]|uniref:DUF3500 domain-containing protein n=1 Tax=Actinoplanes campanulatus TaxID=113559 RepID=A0A7W5FDY5_9ACTN|nr:DUF3500 domain-containing protein [Actinoplanes campanulatus]MBB3094914.1 hypothetical protein [Actinoplanes campanulatus]GGN08308.1 hypothetical protein GCM10010109_17010 [Actinoplanes campanulatus]GID36208.1 hypothetical protein Aca09nite_27140 [Actinoplanes campanulatus]
MRNRWLPLAGVLLMLASAGCGGPADQEPSTEKSVSAAVAIVRSYEKSVAGVVQAAEAFLATLDADEKALTQLELSEANATLWSNLPCGSSCRPGIRFGDLDIEEQAAARSVLKTALGTRPGSGYERVEQIMAADDQLALLQARGAIGSARPAMPTGGPPSGMPSGTPSGGVPGGGPPGEMPSGGPPGGADTAYSSGNYFLAFLGAPSTTGAWMISFGGHHLAVHMSYKNGEVAGASPYFVGVEPITWTDPANIRHAPLYDMRTGLVTMLSSLTETERGKAKLAKTFTDVLLGPGEDGEFPAKKEGLSAGSLTAGQKKLVLAAVAPWVAGADDATAAELMKIYESQIDQTYIGWSGGTSLTNHADYVRIDGPSVWVEFVCQNGVVVQDQIHYHTIYRDHTRDYGGEFTF